MKKRDGKVLLSFDVEEFDLPREHGGEISVAEGVKVSAVGLVRILEVLKKAGVRATFFVTGNFAKERPDLMMQILDEGHEVGCHGVDHFEPKAGDATRSKKIIEKITGRKVAGYRQPRMFEISYEELKTAGYLYDSSVNPAFIPGRYNHFDVPRRPFRREGVVEVPTSVATGMRVPLFWLALHLFPFKIYVDFCLLAIRRDGYFATYFHPWEFGEIGAMKNAPRYIKHNSGKKLIARLARLISELKRRGYEFETYEEFVREIKW